MKIKNTSLKNQRLVLNNEALIFDKDGIAEVKDEEGKFLENLPGYEIVEKATKKPTTKEDKTVEKPKPSAKTTATKKVE